LTLLERCVRIQLLIMDVDGVLSDGGLVYGDDGAELKPFYVRDGVAVKMWRQAGKRAAILTGRSSQTVARRGAELSIDLVMQGADDKLAAFGQLLAGQELQPEQAAYVGDDLPDVPVLRACGLAVAVADACFEARAAAHIVTRADGGRGAVRETIELVLRAQGLWPKTVAGCC
jgi:3-deoxy-D-manno-octulosonate 8-phosphate phosphatase (KDO 8-P phosphatase)